MKEPQFWDEDAKAFVHGPHIPAPTGGTTVDTEARTAIDAILDALRSRGIIAED